VQSLGRVTVTNLLRNRAVRLPLVSVVMRLSSAFQISALWEDCKLSPKARFRSATRLRGGAT